MNVLNKKMTLLIFLYLCGCSFSALSDEISLTRFPGELAQTIDPEGKYIVFNVDSENEEQAASLGGNHALYLQDRETDKQEKIYVYDRYVEVLWSPGGGTLLVNDYAGSDCAIPIIILMDNHREIVNLKEQLRQQIGEEQSIFENHHVYMIGTEWLQEDRLKVQISGYGDADPDGFVYWFEFLIGKGFTRLE